MARIFRKIPECVLVFGATGRLGSQVAKFLQKQHPSVHLRLVSTKESEKGQLQKSWPSSEAAEAEADFFDEPSLHKAVTDVKGVFVVTPGSFDECTAMSNLVKALKQSGNRLMGVFLDFNSRRILKWLMENDLNLPVQSPIAKEILQDSLLPLTFLNIGTTFMEKLFLDAKRIA